MKIRLIGIFLLFLVASTQAQEPIIEVSNSYTTQLIFPQEISLCRLAINEKFFEPQQVNNILLLQANEPFEETNLTVLLSGGLSYAIKMVYASTPLQQSYIFQDIDAVNYFVKEQGENVQAINNEGVKNLSNDDVIDKVLKEKGYISVRNAVKYKTLILSLQGVYIHKEHIYFKLQVENLSQIPYKVELVNFAVTVKKTKDVTSSALEQLMPVQTSNLSEVLPKSKTELVFAFPKFTISQEHELQIDIVEKNGARNLTLIITDELFLTAKQI